MFGKKCPRCKNKVLKNYSYCPYCSLELARKEKDGLLDNIEEEFNKLENESIGDIETLTKEIGKSMGLDFIDKFPFNQIVKKLSKDIEKQFKDIDKEMAIKRGSNVKEQVTRKNGAEIRRTDFPGGFSIQIRMGGTPTSVIKPMPVQQAHTKQQTIKPAKNSFREFDEKGKERLSKLPKEEPETKVRRLTDTVIYEINLPGVKSLKDVTVNQLENSIEIKAISKDRAYFKLIPVALPLKRYHLKDGSLILELRPQA